MNAEQLKGKWLQFKGEVKEKYGKFTDDEVKQIEGKGCPMKGADEWHEKPAPKPVGKGI